jgi:hypothetical protein
MARETRASMNLLLAFIFACLALGLRYERLGRNQYGAIAAVGAVMVVLYLYVTRFL